MAKATKIKENNETCENVIVVVDEKKKLTIKDYIKFGAGFYIGFTLARAAKYIILGIGKNSKGE